jgi:hypothetical protein
MRDMSRAIRHELADAAPTLTLIPTETVREYIQILGAFKADLEDELKRRLPSPKCEEAPPSESSSS